MNFTSTIQAPIDTLFNRLKSSYHDGVEYIQKKIDQHFFQAKSIEKLSQEVESYKQKELECIAYKNALFELEKAQNTTFFTNPKVELVRAISYEKFGDFNKIWLDVKDYNSSKIYGLIYKDMVAGIVIPKNGMPLALLNRDPKSSYAVLIGDAKAPGIAHGNNEADIIVTFIPTWYNIKKGDLVTTSGLDNIFFEGVKVGVITSLTTSQGYQKAVVKPFYQIHDLHYFYMIKKVQ